MGNKKDRKMDEEREQEKPTLDELLAVGRLLLGAPDPEKAAKRKKQLQMLDNLEYPGGKWVH